MKTLPCLAVLLIALALAGPALAEDKIKDDGFVPMFDGKTLKGWVNVNCAPSTFTVKDNQIITTGKPTGYLRTAKQYENFIAEFDWMHIPPKPGAVGNSGFFVWADPIPAVGTGYTRGIEVQVLVNLTYHNKKGEITATSQGDLFSIWGAHCTPDRPHPDGWERCLPNGNYTKGEGEWNHYRVEGNNGRITLTVNGHEVSGVSKCNPRKGYLALESEGSECRFKNLKIKELPSTNPKKDEIADVAEGYRQLYTGLDLSGWKADEEAKKHWQARDTVLHYDGADGLKTALRTEKDYGDAEFVVDFRFPVKKDASCTFTFQEGKGREVKLTLTHAGDFETSARAGTAFKEAGGKATGFKAPGEWNRLYLALKGNKLKWNLNNKQMLNDILVSDKPTVGTFDIRPEGAMDFANLFVRELK